MRKFVLLPLGLAVAFGFAGCDEPVGKESGVPSWLTQKIAQIESQPAERRPPEISRWEYHGQTVYYIPAEYPDDYADLYDADGNLIGHPSGGITGMGEGKITDFFKDRTNGEVLWKNEP
ncbi:MAG: hypothetical protein GXY33_14570 [Phycisphaerae bacterium]|nr:hypothetical protein [Phycisphaerae bacterium]